MKHERRSVRALLARMHALREHDRLPRLREALPCSGTPTPTDHDANPNDFAKCEINVTAALDTAQPSGLQRTTSLGTHNGSNLGALPRNPYDRSAFGRAAYVDAGPPRRRQAALATRLLRAHGQPKRRSRARIACEVPAKRSRRAPAAALAENSYLASTQAATPTTASLPVSDATSHDTTPVIIVLNVR